MSEDVKPTSQAYSRGYADGFADSRARKRQKAKVPFWRSLLSDHFREQFVIGYKQGYWDGEHQIRNEERRKQNARAKSELNPKQPVKTSTTIAERRAGLLNRLSPFPKHDEPER